MGLFDKLFGGDELEAREPGFAGELYPADPDSLRTSVGALLEAATSPSSEAVRALIVPHARLDVAGSVMAEAYASVPGRGFFDRVVVIGSSRLVPFRGLALDAWEGFETPIGVLRYPPLDSLGRPPDDVQVRQMAAAFDPEESLEAQLPFVRHRLGDIQLVPLLVGDTSSEAVREALSWLADERTLVVLSANLSHDVRLDRARELDEACVESVEGMRPEQVGREHTTGRVALQGLLEWADAHEWSARCLARSNSHEQGGGPESVVGYGAFCIEARSGD